MEFEDQEEEEIGLAASFDSLGHGPRVVVAEPNKSGPSIKRPSSSTNRYRECLKNHAVSMGGHAVDGCGEFMPAGEEGTLDALKCAACNCHRNFHRKETDGGGDPFQYQYSPYYRTPHGGWVAAAAQHRLAPIAPLALPSTSGGGGGALSREDQEEFTDPKEGGGGKKRFRTKFSQEQKDKMLEFAEKVGWRIQKHDEAAVQEFCTETCVKRHVLKVWMHNNKHTLGKKP